jgi:hypothetical protein
VRGPSERSVEISPLNGVEYVLVLYIEQILENRRAGIAIGVIEGIGALYAHPRFRAPAKARIVSARRWACGREAVLSRRSSIPLQWLSEPAEISAQGIAFQQPCD